MTNNINSPAVVGIFGLCVVLALLLLFVVVNLMDRNSKFRVRRNDNKIFKAVEEARRDFR